MSSSVDIFKLSYLESVITIAKHIIAQGAADVSEHEFSRVIMGHAKPTSVTRRATQRRSVIFLPRRKISNCAAPMRLPKATRP
jgi:hypothetical protein